MKLIKGYLLVITKVQRSIDRVVPTVIGSTNRYNKRNRVNV